MLEARTRGLISHVLVQERRHLHWPLRRLRRAVASPRNSHDSSSRSSHASHTALSQDSLVSLIQQPTVPMKRAAYVWYCRSCITHSLKSLYPTLQELYHASFDIGPVRQLALHAPPHRLLCASYNTECYSYIRIGAILVTGPTAMQHALRPK